MKLGRDTSAFHPDLRRAAALLPRNVAGPRALRVVRRLETLLDRRPAPDGTEVVPVGDISVRVHRPPSVEGGGLPALLWIHGGGYIGGRAAQDDDLCRAFARRSGLLVAAVEYRRAPEHPFPTPLHDCHDALEWLARHPDVDRSRVAIGGASAGGGLAAALALLARERGVVEPRLQLLSYPMLDDRTAIRDDIDERDLRVWGNASNRFGWKCYLRQEPGSLEVSGLASPARHTDLADLPPAWIGVGTLDLFHDEDIAYAERLRASGVPVDLDVVDGAFHGFDAVQPASGVARDYRDAMVGALAGGLATHGAPAA